MPIAYSLPQIPTTPLGPLSGFYRGQQYDLAMQDAERTFRDSDLANKRLQNLYENELLDNPTKEAERAKKIADAIYEQDLINSGAKRKAFDTEVDSKVASTEGQRLLNKKNEILIASDALTQAAAMPEQAQIGMWGELEAKLKPLGVKFPQGGPTVENRQVLKQMAAASIQTREHLQKLEQQEQHAVLAEGTAYLNRQSQERIAKGHDDASRANAAATAAAMRPQPQDRAVFARAEKELQDTGKVSLETLLAVGEQTIKNDESVKKDLVASYKSSITNSQVNKDKKLSPEEITTMANVLAEKDMKALTLEKAYHSTYSPPVSQKDWEKINAINPKLGAEIKANGKVLGDKQQAGSPTSTPTSTPTATTTTNVLAQAQARFDANPDGAIKALADSQFGGDLAKAKAKYQSDGINTSKASMTPQEYAAKFSQGPTLKGKGLTGATPETILADSPRNE